MRESNEVENSRSCVVPPGGAGDEWAANRSDGREEMWVNGKDGDVSAKNLAEKEIWRSDFWRRKEIGRIGRVR